MARDPNLQAHRDWIGYLQQVGLVVSAPALLAGQAYLNPHQAEEQERFKELVTTQEVAGLKEPLQFISNFPKLAQTVLGWKPEDMVAGNDPSVSELTVSLSTIEATLSPNYVVKELRPPPGVSPWLMLVHEYPCNTPLDEPWDDPKSSWHVSPQTRMERHLRTAGVRIGLIVNDTSFRLVSYMGETPGHLTFPVHAMLDVAGRPIFAAFTLLLGAQRLFHHPTPLRLPALLAESRKYQNLVSTQLAEQVLFALYELVRGIQGAHDLSKGELLKELLRDDPNQIYFGLLTVLMRLVFLLYAEDRGLMCNDPVYLQYYSITGLYERLQEDAGRYPDTMDQRYGAWAQLLALFRLVHSGAKHGGFVLPAREGYLFDPQRFAFLEGTDTDADSKELPLISDGCLFRVLRHLLIIEGERLSYSALDVEQIGSVYEAIMGFRLEKALGPSIAIKAKKTHGAATTINLDTLLRQKGADRAKWLKEHTDQEVTGAAAKELKEANTLEELLGALEKKVARAVTPEMVPVGAIVLQPSDERRRSGSHYTPRALTLPIVKKALEPVIAQLGEKPTPEAILNLKVCDPAMGSGAFLVEACRQLGEHLVTAWAAHQVKVAIPPDENEQLHAMRLVAQRCLYGVDKNPMAVDLAKLSLWLATLAKDHAFTFLDHALRCGDSLVGLSRQQIERFHWEADGPPNMVSDFITKAVNEASAIRQQIISSAENADYTRLGKQLQSADETLARSRLIGDVVVAIYFGSTKPKERENERVTRFVQLERWLNKKGTDEELQALVRTLHDGDHPVRPFHWEIEFPEVFQAPLSPPRDGEGQQSPLSPPGRGAGGEGDPLEAAGHVSVSSARRKRQTDPLIPNPSPPGGEGDQNRQSATSLSGFDAIVGNPPFAGKNTIAAGNHPHYPDWLKALHEESHGNADLVAHFFRRAFGLLRDQGTLGLIATNTIAQGDTRSTGLRWICTHGGTIYHAKRRYKWPGLAAVVVSVVHVAKTAPLSPGGRGAGGEGAAMAGPYLLDDKEVPIITAYLFHAGGHDDPVRLEANAGKSFQGSILLGMGFTFDDTDKSGVANPISLMHELIEKDKRNAERILPFIGWEEVANSPTHQHRRYTIDFFDKSQDEASLWPDLLEIVRIKVKPDRDGQTRDANRERWWQYAEKRPGLYRAIQGCRQVLVTSSQAMTQYGFAMLSHGMVYSSNLNVFPFETCKAFAAMQCRVHESWARFMGATFKDDLSYTPSDCFETFPFPLGFETDARLEAVGKEYYEYRAALMIDHNEGLTKTYNRFHDPLCLQPEIVKLRELHAAMDRAVLDAYGWSDLEPTCEFLLDYVEEDEEGPLTPNPSPPRGEGGTGALTPSPFPSREEGSQTGASLVRGEGSQAGRGKKKPWRFRWPDAFRDEVLARLLELNKTRAEEERRAAEAAKPVKAKGKRGKKAKEEGPGLFGD